MTERVILIVEDGRVNQKVIAAMLQRLGCVVEIVADGQAAVAAVRDNDFDMVFMDCQMPVMDGYAATREIRQAEEVSGGKIPIVAMTANVLPDDKVKCFSAGMDGFMSKPVMMNVLSDMVAKWCPERDSNSRPSP